MVIIMVDVAGRLRDVLPLPTGRTLRTFLDGARMLGPQSQSQSRRARKRRAWIDDLDAGIVALNELGGRGRPSGGTVSSCQASALRHLATSYATAPSLDSTYDPLRAWRALQGQRPGYADSVADDSRSSYQRGAVSLPREGAGRVPLLSILPPRLQAQLVDPHSILRDPCERDPMLEALGGAQAMDPILARRGFLYGTFLGELHKCGIIEATAASQAVAGIFFVKRTDSRLRHLFAPRVPTAN